MKKIFTIFAAVLLTASIFAQSPEKMSYQAIVRDTTGSLVTTTNIGMQISILQGSVDGTVIYVETQTPTTNANGLVTIEIGNGAGFDAIDWSSGPYFIKTETDPVGGTNYTIIGTSQFLSVPYALHAKTAESITGTITETDPIFSGSQAANITSTDITNLDNLSGINTGDQDLSNLATQPALEDTASAIRADIPNVSGFVNTTSEPVVVPRIASKGQILSVSFSGSDSFLFSSATSTNSQVLLSCQQGTSTLIYPIDSYFINNKRIDAVFEIPFSAATGTYDIIIDPLSPEPQIIEEFFKIF